MLIRPDRAAVEGAPERGNLPSSDGNGMGEEAPSSWTPRMPWERLPATRRTRIDDGDSLNFSESYLHRERERDGNESGGGEEEP